MTTPLPPDGPSLGWPRLPRRLRLEVVGLGPDPVFDVPICARVFCVGRGPLADGRLTDPERHLSMRHFTIELRGVDHRLRNLSVNGTRVNGDWIQDDTTERVLADGDVIEAGLFTIKVHLERSPFESLLDGESNWLKSLNGKIKETDDPYSPGSDDRDVSRRP